MKKKLYIITALLLPMFATAQLVQVPYSCGEGNEFTISIPVKFPKNTTVQYVWYRNDTLIEGTQKLLLPNEKAIAYTIPADKAYGTSVAFHFKYCLNDECSEVWTRSPRYLVNFLICLPPQVSAITGSTTVCASQAGITYFVAGTANVAYSWVLPAGWMQTAGGNTSSITVRSGTASGVISVMPGNACGVGTASTLAVTVNNVSVPGSISSVTAYSCSGGISSAGAVSSVTAYSCSGGISDAGVISLELH